MPIIVSANMKGGSGKSSTCHHLGGWLAHSGHKVLLVDVDPQGSLTQGLWGRNRLKDLDPGVTAYAVYDGANYPPGVIHETQFKGLHLIPGHRKMREWNRKDEYAWVDHEFHLRDLLSQVRWDYDYILIDTPPNLELCTHAALMAADFVVVPVQMEDYGMQGVDEVNESIEQAQGLRESPIRILGYLPTMYNKQTVLHNGFKQLLEDQHGELVFRTTIPRSLDFPMALGKRQCVSVFKKQKGLAHQSMVTLAEEIKARAGAA